MDIKMLKNNIYMSNIPKFMIFNVENQALCKQYIDAISSTLHYNKDYLYIDEATYKVSNGLIDNSISIVINSDKEFISNVDKYFEYFRNCNKYIIIYLNHIDKSTGIYKKYKDFIYDFNNLDKFTVLAYLLSECESNKISISQDKLLTLIDYCECDFGKCLNELDKVIVLGQENSNILADYLLDNGFSDYRNTNSVKFATKVLNRDLSVFDDSTRLRDSVVTVIGIVYRLVKNKLTSGFCEERLLRLLKLCIYVDCCVKDGSLDDTEALKLLLLDI